MKNEMKGRINIGLKIQPVNNFVETPRIRKKEQGQDGNDSTFGNKGTEPDE
jgi:hypothetical protein